MQGDFDGWRDFRGLFSGSEDHIRDKSEGIVYHGLCHECACQAGKWNFGVSAQPFHSSERGF